MNLGVGLLCLDRRDTIAHMLAAKSHRITTTQTGVEQDRNPYALSRSKRPARLVCRNVFLGPDGKSIAGLKFWILHRCGGICFYETGLCCPFKEAAHGVQKVPGLKGSCYS